MWKYEGKPWTVSRQMHYEANSVTLNGNLWRLLPTGRSVFKKGAASIGDVTAVLPDPVLLLEHNS